MGEYFPERISSKERVKFQIDLSNCDTKGHLKNTTGTDRTKFAKTGDSVNSKSDVDKLGIDKLKDVLRKLSNSTSKVNK